MSERLRLDMTMADVFCVMAEGNPGALTACCELFKKAPQIDPDAVMGGIMPILHLDSLGIYSSRIYMLWSDVCQRNTTSMLALLRANQLGFLDKEKLDHAIDNYGDGLDLQECLTLVRERLPRFAAEVSTAESVEAPHAS